MLLMYIIPLISVIVVIGFVIGMLSIFVGGAFSGGSNTRTSEYKEEKS